MSNRLLSRSLVVAVASLSVVAVGCGATGGSGAGGGGSQAVTAGVAPRATQVDGLRQAAMTTRLASTEKVAVTVRTTPANGDPSVTVTSTGEIDGENGRAHIVADIAGTAGGRSGEATVEAVYDGDTVYVKAPFTDLVADTEWVRVTSPELGAQADRLAGLQQDPGSFVAFLEGADGSVETIGTEEVRGVPTRHVRVELDPQYVLDSRDPVRRAELTEHLAAWGVSLEDLPTLPAEAWIDDDGYVRRFSVSFDLADLGKVAPGASATGVVTQTIELYDFDQPVDIAIPPAAEVTTLDVSKLLGDLRPGD